MPESGLVAVKVIKHNKMKKKRIVTILVLLITALLLVSCRSQQRFGQRKAPKNCHTCTKWGK